MTTTTKYTAIKVESEYNAEQWWEAVRDAAPTIAKSLERNGHAVVTESVYDALAALPGFAGGPEYAPTALIHCGSEEDQWGDVVSTKHGVFEEVQ